MNRLLSGLLALAAVAAGPANAQCFGPDNLTGPCCQPVAANLPQFPGFDLPGLGICWSNCLPAQQPCIRVSFSAPAPTACGQYTSSVTIFDCNGVPLMFGSAVLDYTRTWDESPVPGVVPNQVWRFATKVDLGLGPVFNPSCVVPTCLPTHPTAFFYGYVDYSLDCINGTFDSAVVLFHGCDELIHRPGLSDRPGVFHPTRSYGLVAPHTSANPFVPGALIPPGGPLIAEAMRTVLPPIGGAALCQTEELISQGQMFPIISGCLCPLSFNSTQQSAVRLDGIGSCPDPAGLVSSFNTLNFWPIVPWFEMIVTSIGSWTTGASYPGPESAWVNEGLFRYHDSCQSVAGVTGDTLDVFYGATTAKGFPVVPTSPVFPPSENFTDLASNLAHPVGTPVPLPIIGSVRKTDHLIYVNVP